MSEMAGSPPIPSVLVTGASRGLGLEFARQYAADGWRVHAAARRPLEALELQRLAAASGGRLAVHALEVCDHAQVDALARSLAGSPIDVLINCAGIMGRETFATGGMAMQRFGSTDFEEWIDTLRTNLLAPMKIAEAFVEHVAASEQKKIVTLTSILGSMARNQIGGLYAYRSSKAGVNAMMKSMAIDLRRRGIIAVPMHPGWVRTDLGGPRAELDCEASVTGMRRVIAALTPAQSGSFLQWDGGELPW